MLDAHPTSLRSVLLALLLGVGSAAACIDETTLENADCLDDDDCFSSQTCVITDYQLNNTTSREGWCRPKDEGCKVGEQPGCACEVLTAGYECTGTFDGVSLCTSEETNACICVLAPDVSGADAMATACPM